MFTIEYVKNLKWENAEHTIFSCIVKYKEFNEEHPAGINQLDPYDHIKEIWVKGNNGEYGEIEEYIAPPPQEYITPVSVPTVTPLQYVERFTDAEQLAIVAATMTNPAIKLWYDKLMAASEVVFSDPRLSAGMDAMVAAGLITQARSEEILPLDVRSTGMTTA